MFSYAKWVAPVLLLVAGGLPALADSMCTAGSYSTIQGTTCDIGSLQFTFGLLSAQNYSYDASTGSYVYDSSWTASDVSFTPTASGFALGLTNFDSQSITAPANGSAADYIYIPFSVTALSGEIVRTTASGGTPSVSSGSNYAVAYPDYVFLSGATGYQQAYSYLENDYGTPFSGQYQYASRSLSSGSVDSYPFYLQAATGGTASITGTTATFDFLTAAPEPDTCLIAGAALVGLGLLARKRRVGR
jgi:hypothetical protein